MTVTPTNSSTPSISFNRLSRTPSCVPLSTAAGEREDAKASISSCAHQYCMYVYVAKSEAKGKRTKKIIDGDALRAWRKISLTARSDSPTYLFSSYRAISDTADRQTADAVHFYIVSTSTRSEQSNVLTSGPRTATKFTPLSAAVARTNSVLLHPGGPHSNTPLGARTPRRASLSRCTSGHSTHSRKRAIVLASPPMSAKRTGGVAIACARSVDGRTVGSAAARSAAVRCAADSAADGRGAADAKKRLMASVPASRTTAARSAPT